MATFGVEVTNCGEAYNFFSETRERLQSNSLVKNPFKGEIKKRDNMYIINIEPIYINFTPLVWALAIGGYFITGFHWWHYGLIAVGCLGIFWTKYFFYFFLKKGLKKKGYTGKTKLINKEDVIKKGVFEWDNKRSCNF